MYFTFNGESSETYGLKIVSMDPPQRSSRRAEVITIPGRSEPLLQRGNEHSMIENNIEFAMIYNVDTIRSVFNWLSGTGPLIRSDESDKYYTVNADARIMTERVCDGIYTVKISLQCMPFAYAVGNDPVEVELSGSAATIEIGGSYYCQPVYKVFGSGDITLTINESSDPLKLFDVDGYAIVDSTLLMCHKDGTHVKSSGKLPFMPTGTNLISVVGNVTGIEITKNERWL